MKFKTTLSILLFVFLVFLSVSFHSITASAEENVLYPASVLTSSGDRWGYIDQNGTFSIKPDYGFAGEFNEKGVAIVANGNSLYDVCKVSFINKSGKVTAGPFSSYIPEFRNGLAILRGANEDSVVVDSSGKVILKTKYRVIDYQDGMLSFYDNKLHYGFMDLKGKVVIPAKYFSVNNFENGKAVVEVNAGKFSVINKAGKVIEELKYYNTYNSSEGLTSYYDEKSKKTGYKFYNGTIAIQPLFYTAGPFKDGYAVVEIESNKSANKYGLIDKKGNFVIQPEYSGINYVGSGLYAVSIYSDIPYSSYYLPKALFNSKGKQLTDFKYYRIGEFQNGYSTASDSTSTFFIDKTGNIVDKLSKLQGIGEMKFIGNVLQAKLDGGLTYLKENGEVIWQKDNSIPLKDGIKVKKVAFRPDYFTFIEYPELSGMENTTVQDSINNKLKAEFLNNIGSETSNDDEEYLEELTRNFSTNVNKDLLIIDKSGYWYPVGAAHGMPSQDYFYIDLKTGVFYQLKDLFKSGSNYADKLTSLVKNQILLDERVATISGGLAYFDTKVTVSEDQPFILGSDSLKIYYHPYEIAPYAAGFPEFEIPYGQISSIIDTKGAFWNAFDKTVVNHKPKLFWDINNSTVKEIENTINLYEQNIITAINNNKFASVEPYLLKGSNLYNSQKKLVSSLYKKNTREKLVKYEIYAIEQVNDSSTYRVYVFEEIGVKYSGKDYVNNKYSWCYTVKLDTDSKFKLSDILKW